MSLEPSFCTAISPRTCRTPAPSTRRRSLPSPSALTSDPYPSPIAPSPVDTSTREPSIGPYVLGRTVGRGTFARVKIARHTLTGAEVAVKIISREKLDSSDLERVSREIQILKHLEHPNICHLLEVFDTPRHIYLVMEFAGGELFDYIVSHGRLREREAARFMHQIISAVGHCHALNIVHRDIKPENILLDENRKVKMIDFGLSNILRAGRLRSAVGSPSYAAPEMITAAEDGYGTAADIWSCGVVFYTLLVGTLPFEDPTTQGLYQKIIKGTYTLPETISAPCRQLLAEMLEPSPAQRITAQGVLDSPFMRLHGHTAPTAPWPSTRGGAGAGAGEEVEVDPGVVDQCVKAGFSREEVVRSVANGSHNSAAATYFLLHARQTTELAKDAELDRRRADEREKILTTHLPVSPTITNTHKPLLDLPDLPALPALARTPAAPAAPAARTARRCSLALPLPRAPVAAPAAAAAAAGRRASVTGCVGMGSHNPPTRLSPPLAPSSSPPLASSSASASTSASPRTPHHAPVLRGSAFNALQTSLLPPQEVLVRVAAGLRACGLVVNQCEDALYTLRGRTVSHSVIIEAVICRIAGLNDTTVIKLSRVGGEPFAYQKLAQQVMESWDLE